jgi:SAM-dependent methyltransferase
MNNQQRKYNELYKETNFNFDLPDYKITDGGKIYGKKILVLGVGTARDVRYLVKDNNVWGVDFSESAIKQSTKIGIHAQVADIERPLKFNNSSFDIVVAKDILEHLENPMFVLSEMRRVLKPSGYAVINVPNHFFYELRLRMLFGKNLIWKTFGHDHTKLFKEWNYMHKFFLTWDGFQEMLSESKLKIVRTFWDFGTLAHYSEPETVFTYFEQLRPKYKKFISAGRFGWKVFNFIFPMKLRSYIVSLSPSFWCASFYVWCKK